MKDTEIVNKELGRSKEKIMRIEWKINEAERRLVYLKQKMKATQEKYESPKTKKADLLKNFSYVEWATEDFLLKDGTQQKEQKSLLKQILPDQKHEKAWTIIEDDFFSGWPRTTLNNSFYYTLGYSTYCLPDNRMYGNGNYFSFYPLERLAQAGTKN